MANLLALAAATAVLVMVPGPNVALIVANSLRHGVRMGAVTVLGTTLGVAVQLVAVVIGIDAIVELVADALTWIRWAGVGYLIWLGVRTWREPADELSGDTAAPALFWRGSLVAAANPKTLMFNAAFLPQFVTSATNLAVELTLVASVFLAVLLVGDMVWVTCAGAARRLLQERATTRNRITGGFLVMAGIGLALSRRGT